MPYSLQGNTVIRADTGAVVKQHPTKAKALAHLRALKVNVENQEAEWRALDEHAEAWLPTSLDEQEANAALKRAQKMAGVTVAAKKPKSPKAQAAAALKQAQKAAGVTTEARLQESEKTAALSVTPSPFSTSTTSNWIARTGGLPAYIQNVAKGIMKSGKSESTAIASAIAVMKRWAAGVGHVSPEVRAAAAKALAEWEAKRAAAHAESAVKKVASAVSGGSKSSSRS